MKLIKLQDKFILVSDEEIKEGDSIIFQHFDGSLSEIYKVRDFNPGYINFTDGEYIRNTSVKFKIISENPDFSLLSEADCKIIGWVDVEKLAEQYAKTADGIDIPYQNGLFYGFIEGFKTAQSLNDKLFSLEDMKKAINLAYVSGGGGDSYQECEQFVEEQLSLQQTSWDVEVEMEQYTQNLHKDIWYNRPKITNNSIRIVKIL